MEPTEKKSETTPSTIVPVGLSGATPTTTTITTTTAPIGNKSQFELGAVSSISLVDNAKTYSPFLRSLSGSLLELLNIDSVPSEVESFEPSSYKPRSFDVTNSESEIVGEIAKSALTSPTADDHNDETEKAIKVKQSTDDETSQNVIRVKQTVTNYANNLALSRINNKCECQEKNTPITKLITCERTCCSKKFADYKTFICRKCKKQKMQNVKRLCPDGLCIQCAKQENEKQEADGAG